MNSSNDLRGSRSEFDDAVAAVVPPPSPDSLTAMQSNNPFHSTWLAYMLTTNIVVACAPNVPAPGSLSMPHM